MGTGHRYIVGTFVAFAAACTGGQSGNEGFFDGGGAEGGGHHCSEYRVQELGWDEEASSLGVSAAEAFAGMVGTCTAPLSWDASGLRAAVEPSTGQAEVSVQVEVDRGSVRAAVYDPGRNGADSCGDSLTVDAHVRIRTSDGTFDDESDVTLRYDESGVALIEFGKGQASLGGSLEIHLAPGASATLRYQLDGAKTCAGELVAYERLRNGDAPQGAADRVRTLKLSPVD